MTAPNEQDYFERSRSFQAFYDDSLREVGIRIPAPVLGQTTNEYRRKTLAALQRALLPRNHELARVNFNDMKSDALQAFEPQALDACKRERTNPANILPGQLKPIKTLDAYGRVQQTTFIGGRLPNGEQTCFVSELTRPGRRVVSFATGDGRIYDAAKGSWR
jgi:hypothetical protein